MSDDEQLPETPKPPRKARPRDVSRETSADAPWKHREAAEAHHALFRPPDGHNWPPEKFDRIYVARVSQTGELEEAPGWFSPDELTDTDRLRDRFGGGVYELRAIRRDGSTYRKIRTNRIAGSPKSLLGAAEAEPAAIAPAAAPAGDPMLVFMQMMMAESRASAERSMQMMTTMMSQQASMQNQQTNLLVAALQGQKVDVGAIVGSVAEHLRPPAPVPVPPGQQSGISMAKDVLELAKAVQPQKEETVAEVVGAIGQAMGAMAAMNASGPQQQQQQQQQQQPPKQMGPAG